MGGVFATVVGSFVVTFSLEGVLTTAVGWSVVMFVFWVGVAITTVCSLGVMFDCWGIVTSVIGSVLLMFNCLEGVFTKVVG